MISVKCIVVLPCYNEEKNLESLLTKIDEALRSEVPYMVIAVNDGSSDGTPDLLRKLSVSYPVTVVEHPVNRGLAEAIRSGIDAALKSSDDSDLVVIMDSDNTHDPIYIRSMLEYVKDGADIVIGSRYVEGGGQINVHKYRVFLSRVVNLLLKWVSRLPVNDATSGYRCFRATTLRRAKEKLGQKFLESKNFEVSFELLLKASFYSLTIKEVPILLDYSKKRGRSKMKLLPTIGGYLQTLMKIKRWRKMLEANY